MDGEIARIRPRLRFGLRGMIVLLLVVAAGLAVLRPLVREPFRWIERYTRVKLNERDLYRHINEGRGVAEGFARALRSGRYEDARELSTADFLVRTGPGGFLGAKGSPLARRRSELIEGVLSFSDDRGRFVSRYTFRFGDDDDRVSLDLVTESGRLKVDRVESEAPTGTKGP
jgi:hypothetical protein